MNMLDGNTYVRGQFSADLMILPVNAVGNAQVQANAGIAASKLEHQHLAVFSQSGNAVAATKAVYAQLGTTGVIDAVRVGSIVPADTGGSCTVDVRKNGTTVLTGVVTLNDTHTAYQLVAPGGFTSTALVAGDVLTVVVGGITGTVPVGVFCQVVIRSQP